MSWNDKFHCKHLVINNVCPLSSHAILPNVTSFRIIHTIHIAHLLSFRSLHFMSCLSNGRVKDEMIIILTAFQS